MYVKKSHLDENKRKLLAQGKHSSVAQCEITMDELFS